MSTQPFTPPPNTDFVPAPFNPPPANTPAAPAVPPSTPPNSPPKPPASVEQNLKGSAEAHFAEKPATPAPKADAKPAAEAPAEAKPAAPAEPADPFAHIKPEDGMSEKSLTGWKALKTEATQKVRDAEKKYTPAQTEDADRLKSELKQARDALAVYDLRHDPDFTRQYVEPKKKALDEAKMLLTDNAVDAPDIKALLDKPRAEFAKVVSELASKLPDFDKGSLVASMREAYRLHGEENGALTKAGELKQQIESKRALEARKAFDEGKSEFTSRIPEMQIPEGADQDKIAEVHSYNEARQAAIAEAEKFAFGKMSEREVAGIATRAASLNLVAHHVLPAMKRDLDKATALNRELAAELTAIKKGKTAPGFNEGATPSKGPDYSKLPPEKAFEAMAETHFGRR